MADRQKVIQAAEKLVARGRIQAAIDEYCKVLDRHPNDTSTLNRVGDLYARLNRMQKAIDLFQKTAESFGRQGFFVKAIAIYKKIIRLDPGQIRAYESLADLYNRQGLTGDSLAQYQVVADYYVKHGDGESAIGVYRTMVDIEPNNPTRRLHLAGMLQRAGKVGDALEQYFEIASLMLAHSRGEDALRVLEGALAVEAKDLEFVRRAMHALQDAGFDRLGEQLLEAAVKLNPQAHVLRLDTREKETAVLDEEPAAAEAAVGEAEVAAEAVADELEESPEAEEAPATAEADEAAGDAEEVVVLEDEVLLEVEVDVDVATAPDDEEEIDLGAIAVELEEPGLVEAEEPAAETVLDLDTPQAGQAFVLEDVEDDTAAGAVAEAAEAADAEPATLGEDLGFELDLDEVEEEVAAPAAAAEPAVAAEEAADLAEAEPAETAAEMEPAETAAETEPAETEPAETVVAEPAVEEEAIEVEEVAAPAVAAAEEGGEEVEAPIEEAAAPPVAAEAPVVGEETAEETEEEERVLEEVVTESRGGRAAAARLGSEFEVSGESIKLLIEAEVLSRYGMDEMAITVLERILESDGRHAEAMARLVRLQLRADRTDEALAVANRLADLVQNVGAPKSWPDLCEALARRGFLLTEGRFVGELTPRAREAAAAVAPPAAEVEPAPAEVEPAAEAVADEAAAAGLEPPAEPAEPEELAAPVVEEEEPAEEVAAEIEEAAAPPEPSIEELVAETASRERNKPHRMESTEDVLAGVIEEIERESSAAPAPGAETEIAAPAAEEEPELASAEEIEEEWLRELEREGVGRGVLEPPVDEFVDLATELEAELIEEGALEDDLLPSLREQSLEDIVEGFRKGMAETLSDEDYDTHYNLGIAYREMGLIDEAIGEFQMAAKDPRYLVECCSLLASCFVDKNFHDLAVQWYVRGLESPALDEQARLGLLYELGTLLAATGEPEAARARFREIYGINSNYRDVVAKLEELSH